MIGGLRRETWGLRLTGLTGHVRTWGYPETGQIFVNYFPIRDCAMSGENVRTSDPHFSPKNDGFDVRNHVRIVSGHVRRTRFDDVCAHKHRHDALQRKSSAHLIPLLQKTQPPSAPSFCRSVFCDRDFSSIESTQQPPVNDMHALIARERHIVPQIRTKCEYRLLVASVGGVVNQSGVASASRSPKAYWMPAR